MNVSRFTMSRPGFPGIIIIVYDKIGKGPGVYRTSVVCRGSQPLSGGIVAYQKLCV